jgi:hypothetical protein
MKLQRWKKLTEYVFKIDGTAVLSAALCMILSCVLVGNYRKTVTVQVQQSLQLEKSIVTPALLPLVLCYLIL